MRSFRSLISFLIFSAHTFSVGENKVTIERTVRGVEGLEPDESVKFFAGCAPAQLLELLLQIVFVGRKWLAKGMPKLQDVLMSVAVLVALVAIIISEDKNYVEEKSWYRLHSIHLPVVKDEKRIV